MAATITHPPAPAAPPATRRRTRLVAALVASLLLVSGGVIGWWLGSDRGPDSGIVDRWAAALLSGDGYVVAALYTEDAVWDDHGSQQTYSGRLAIATGMEALFGHALHLAEATPTNVVTTRHTVIAVWTWTGTAQGSYEGSDPLPVSAVVVTAFQMDGGLIERTDLYYDPASLFPEITTEEVSFQSGDFELVGDLVLPAGEGPHPAVIVVNGGGCAKRNSAPGYRTLSRSFAEAGFALFSWDKPGCGESAGELGNHPMLRRAAVLADALDFVAGHPEVDRHRIGLWGYSQAGWVIPMALQLTDGIDFLIMVSSPGETNAEQMAHQVAQRLACQGGSAEMAASLEEQLSLVMHASTYEDYVAAMLAMNEIEGAGAVYPSAITPERDWMPLRQTTEIFFDPMEVIEDLTVPVLAVFGWLDKNIDPFRASVAYESAMRETGNPHYQVRWIPGVGHTMQEQETGCIGEPGLALSERYIEIMESWIGVLAGSR
jgi:uncharacterized protein (TIGR02246 family)